jgi:hypothetical protein
MILLDSPAKSLRLRLGAPVASLEPSVVVAWEQLAEGRFLLFADELLTTGTTPLELVPSPDGGRSFFNRLRGLALHQRDTATVVATVEAFDGSNAWTLWQGRLAPGETLTWGDGEGWRIHGVSAGLLSGSTDGRPIKIAATATPGTLIHTSDGVAPITLWASNTDAVDQLLTIEWGGAVSPDDLIQKTIVSRSGLTLLVDGLVLQAGAVARAFAATANVVNIVGKIGP